MNKKQNIIIDPAFLRDSNYSYVNYDDNELATVLCFSIARKKEDLILHQQRIELYAQQNNTDLLFSAMVDLFTALEEKGKDYKKRIFTQYKNKITIRQSLVLRNLLNTSTHAISHIKDLNESILNFGIKGKLLSSKYI